ncbi:MAG: twin-arginine translocase subunit TatC [Trueperaceae bacterium]|nr:twin-arginine translocase subunit TatC [Trueperaceae bacterium]MCC6310866.1 twin-arginine translocase subunit TatC [Trueperaceae bacterium]MCO5173988.1 twin-arginine translocase subunit TatC [Trueperaceae bacterium]MCW5819200.1 twin-arginine translocase subunit TatC [Trueperaceae bacterium]
MTLIEHFEELRNRLFIALLAWLVASGVAFAFRFEVLEWLKAPLPASMTLNYFAVLEPFTVSMQVASFFGLVIASPVIIGQVWGFVAPGLYAEERRYAVPFILFAALAFAAGVAFSYYVVLPFSIPILLSFLGDEAQGLLSIGKYISTLLMLMAMFGIMFELPVLGFLLARIGILRHAPLVRYRRWAIVGGVAAAAIITPTGDPFNLALVAVPFLVLYEVTVVVVRISERRHGSQRRMRHAREDPEPTRSY